VCGQHVLCKQASTRLCCTILQEAIQAELAALDIETEQPGPAHFTLNFLWLDKNVAVSVDQLFDEVCALCASVHITVTSNGQAFCLALLTVAHGTALCVVPLDVLSRKCVFSPVSLCQIQPPIMI